MEPVSLADLKVHLNVDASDTDFDAYITSLIVPARRACELRLNRSVIGSAELLVLDAFPTDDRGLWYQLPLEAPSPRGRDILLAGGAVSAISSISYVDADGVTQQLASTAYIASLTAQDAAIAPVGRWPATADEPGAVRISYIVGPLSPDDFAIVGQAVRLLVGSWYANREADAVDVRGIPTELPLSVTWLLGPLRKWADD